MGGLRRYMPITWITTLLGSLALIGTPLFSGFYSKDEIILAIHASKLYGSEFAYFAVLAGVFITAFYSFRMYFLVFHGEERFDKNPDANHDAHHGDDHHGHEIESKPHESAWVVTVPLILLAIPAVLIGFFTIEPMLFGDFFKDSIFVDLRIHQAMEVLREDFHGPLQLAIHGLTSAPFWLALAGVVLSYYMYIINPALPTAIKRIFLPIYTLLDNKYYLDWFNENVLARGARALGGLLWENDKKVIDGTLVNGSWKIVRLFSAVIRRVQTGYIYHYALSMIAGVFVLMTYFVWLKP